MSRNVDVKTNILHSDLNAYYASVEINERPELRDKDIAVCGSTENRHGIVLAKSYSAKANNWEKREKRKAPDDDIDDIDTMSEAGELLLTILSSCAQAESLCIIVSGLNDLFYIFYCS